MPAVLDRVLSRFGRKAEVPIINDGADNKPTVTVRQGFGMAPAFWTEADYESMARSGYRRNTDVYACVSLIAQAAKQVKWWDGAGESKTSQAILRKAIDRGPLAPAAGEHASKLSGSARLDPGPSLEVLTRSGGRNFVEHWISYLLLAGNAYMEIERLGTRGDPYRITLDNPLTVYAEPNRDAVYARDAVKFWKVSVPFRGAYPRILTKYDYDAPPTRARGDLVQSKLFNPHDPIYGMAPLEAALLKVDVQNEGASLLKRILQRGYSPGWIEATEESEWDDVQVARLRERIRNSKAAGEELFLENARWHEMGIKPVDTGVSEQQLLSKRDIASVFHVDPVLIGDVSSRTYATYAQSRLALYMEAVIPPLSQFRDDWNRSIGAELNSPLDFDRDSFDAIAAARSEACDRVVKLWSTGLITQDEARADLEYDPARAGDVFYGPANLVPLADDAGPQGAD